MDIQIVPDIYSPTVDKNGNYVDTLILFPKNGFYCPCNNKHKIYKDKLSFATHIYSKTHKNWILYLNDNKLNYYSHSIRLEQDINNLKKIIANQDIEIQKQSNIIVHLTNAINERNKIQNPETQINLLDF